MKVNEKTNQSLLERLQKRQPCGMCLNARCDPDDCLTDENDFSDIGVGQTSEGFRIGIASGYGKPMRINITMWNKKIQRNETVGIYYPKFCPNCGRPLTEYELEGENK